MSHWTYKGKAFDEIPEGAFGFVYRITEKYTRKKYIGKKQFFSTRRVKQKGKKRRKVVVKESNWKTYTGSSKNLNEVIEKKGKEKFKFEILAIGYTKGQCNYLEEAIQFKLDVIIDDSYYNDSVGSRKYIGVKIDDEFKRAINSIVL